jgi:hypothetical protein
LDASSRIWEYLVLPRTQAETTTRQLAQDLAPLGEHGWELVTVWVVNDALGDQFIFKRPKAQPEDTSLARLAHASDAAAE